MAGLNFFKDLHVRPCPSKERVAHIVERGHAPNRPQDQCLPEAAAATQWECTCPSAANSCTPIPDVEVRGRHCIEGRWHLLWSECLDGKPEGLACTSFVLRRLDIVQRHLNVIASLVASDASKFLKAPKLPYQSFILRKGQSDP